MQNLRQQMSQIYLKGNKKADQLLTETRFDIQHHRSKGTASSTIKLLFRTFTHRYDEMGNRFKTNLPNGNVLNQMYYGSHGRVMCKPKRRSHL